jgi:trehalose 6-phosphate synthase
VTDRVLAADHRDGQCASTLAAIYYGRTQPPAFQQRWRDAYREVNQRYAAAIANAAADAASVLIFGLHLHFVPAFLRELRPDLRIGFVLTEPFPPVQLFRQLPSHHGLLSGLLGADLIAFQRQQSARNFQQAATGTPSLPMVTDRHVVTDGRRAWYGVHPLPADTTTMRNLSSDPRTIARATQIRSALRGPRTVLLSVSGWNPGEGVEQRLDAYARLLSTRRADPADTALIHLALACPQGPAQQQHRQDVQRRIAQINGTYASIGRPVVHFQHCGLTPADLAACYVASDVLIDTPLHDDPTWTAQEYLTVHGAQARIVRSNLTGDLHTRARITEINPHHVDALARAIAAELTAAPNTPAATAGQQRVTDADAGAWLRTVLTRLRSAAPTPSRRRPAPGQARRPPHRPAVPATDTSLPARPKERTV